MKRRPWFRLIGHFATLFAVVLIALAALWPHVAPIYTSSIAAVARPVFRWVEAPDRTVLDLRDDTLSVYRIVGAERIAPVLDLDRYAFIAVIPLVALFAATPGLGVRRRVSRTIGGLVMLWTAQVLYVVVAVQLVYAVLAGRDVSAWELIVRILWEAAPIAIWASLTGSTWKKNLKTLRTRTIEHDGSPHAMAQTADG